MSRKRLIKLALLPTIVATLGASHPPAADVIDAGTFTLYVDGERVGEERFVIREDRGGDVGPIYRTGAQLNLKLENRTSRIKVAFEGIGSRCRLRRYEVEISGVAARTLVAEARGNRIGLRVRSPGGEEMKEFLTRGETTVLDLNIAHHYFFILKQLGSGNSATTYILNPRQRSLQQMTIADRGVESTGIAGRNVQLRHVTATAEDGTVHHVWTRDNKIMKVEVPALQFVAERSPGDLEGTGSP